MYVERLLDAERLPREGLAPERAELFAAEARRKLLSMRVCAWLGDGAGLAAEAAELKLSSGALGAVCLQGVCTEIEQRARQGRAAGLEGRVEYALRVLEATRVTMLESPLFSRAGPCSNMAAKAQEEEAWPR